MRLRAPSPITIHASRAFACTISACTVLACSGTPQEDLSAQDSATAREDAPMNSATGGTTGELGTGGTTADVSPSAPAPTDPPAAAGTISITASSSDTNVPVNVLDGRLVTRWSAHGEGEWLLIDLGEVRSLSSVDIAFYQGNVRASVFELQVGTDPDALNSVYSGNSSGTSYRLESYSFAEQPVRYIKIIGNGTTEGVWNGITEVRWDGFDPTQPIMTLDPPEPDPGGSPEDPADVLSLDQWKITLPTGSVGDPDEIEQPELNNYEHQEYFFVNAAETGVVFRAPSGGVATENSSYPRSELREMTGSSGQNQASWSTTSGTHVMTLSGSITKVALNKPHVVVAQIHDNDDDVVMVRFEGHNPGEPTTHGELFVESNGDNVAMLNPNYALGDVYDITIEASGGQIKVDYNGQEKMDRSFSVSNCYFKAGCYSQSKTNNDDSYADDSATDFAEVVLYDLTVTHY